MAEWYVRRGRLIARAQFEAEIASLKTTKTLAIKALAFNVLKHDIPVAITNRMPAKPFGVLFSGGLDSTLIAVVCKRAAAPFTCYTVGLKAAGLEFAKAEAFVTPRRLTLVVDGLPLSQPDVREERRGPRADAPEKALQGFLGSVGLTLEQ